MERMRDMANRTAEMRWYGWKSASAMSLEETNTQRYNRLLFWGKILAVVGATYFFIVGIGTMGDGFKLFGKDFAKRLLETTASPFVGLFIGLLATAIVQSSSTVTSIVVGMVAGGAITIPGAVPIVMGANIGTTVTSKLVSLGHLTHSSEFRRAFAAASVHDTFNLITTVILFPLEYYFAFLSRSAQLMARAFEGVGGMKLSNPLKAITEPAIGWIIWICREHPLPTVLVGMGLTFVMLYLLVRLLRNLMVAKLEAFFDEHLFRNAGRALMVGLIMTVAVQSSSITTSLVVPLAGAGVLRLIQIFPFTIGANLGTTMTAMLAALATGMEEAVTIAFAHFLFNAFGGIIIWPVPAVRRFPIRVAEKLAEVSLRNRLIPIVLIILVFFVIPLILTWGSIARNFGGD